MVKPKGTKPLNINLSDELWAKIDKYRFKEMFASRTEAIVYLLTYALKQSPKREQPNKPPAE
jgi:metal-responsive CopG/Arc/MetJ family transcriptional regulator